MTTFDPDKITFFAKTDARGQEVPFGIKAKDRQRHMYVIGKTGMGKSTLLENMAAQDIQTGEGVAFIDPHGSAAETLLNYVPEHRVQDVVYFAPFDLKHPVSFNVMEDVGPDKRHLVVSGLMSTFKKIWVDAWSARMEYILTNALLALIEYPDTTLLSVNRLFVDRSYRERVVEYIKDPAVKSFWVDEFANYTDRFAAEALPAIQNKIGQFTGNPLIRNIIGQPQSSFDIRQLMDERKILIMNLSKGLIGETNANLLGSMLTTRIYLAAMSRADLPLETMKTMPNFYFYVDEFQSFANATFADILSEARKYHLNLIIAHQYIQQMEEEVKDAVFGNVGTTVAFRVGPFDAEVLETVFAPRFEAADLVNLGFAQIYLTLMIDGIGSQPFSAVTLPPIEKPRVNCRDMVIDSSRRLYARDRETVEKIVADLHAPDRTEMQSKNSQGNNNKNKNSNNKNHKPGGKPNGFGNNSNGKFSQSSGANGARTKAPVYAERTPEELRSILAKVAGKDAASDGTPSRTPRDRSNTASTDEQSSQSHASSKRPTKATDQPASQPSPAKSAAAADQSTANTRRQSKTRANYPNATRPPQQAVTTASQSSDRQPETGSKHRDELRSVLQQVAQAQPAARTESAPAKSQDTASVKPPKPPTAATSHTPSTADTQLTPQEAQPDTLDPALIKKMLHHSDQERSPFQ